jgi:hypothetical protein
MTDKKLQAIDFGIDTNPQKRTETKVDKVAKYPSRRSPPKSRKGYKRECNVSNYDFNDVDSTTVKVQSIQEEPPQKDSRRVVKQKKKRGTHTDVEHEVKQKRIEASKARSVSRKSRIDRGCGE